MKKVIIIGGGLAGLVASILLSRKGVPCVLMERKKFPFHRVCGEYISNETLPFLKAEGLFPTEFNPPSINRFQLSSIKGKSKTLPLDLGGFGISRYAFDNFLVKQARIEGVDIHEGEDVEEVLYEGEELKVITRVNKYAADVLIGSFGKRSKLDLALDREFIKERSPYIGVKYHLRTDIPADLISLHNFRGGYCGVSRIENGTVNLCYLSERKNVKKFGSIPEMEKQILWENPLLKSILLSSDFIFEKPIVINEISFATKEPVKDHILMAGDAAGMITPLCGNGMAMAIHSAKLVSGLVFEFCKGKISRDALEKSYANQWRKTFASRLWAGRQIQRLFGSEFASNIAINLAIYSKPIANAIIRNTHGETF